jgi:hypothetical protein
VGKKIVKQHYKEAINTHISQTRGSFSSDGTSLKSTRVCTFVAKNKNKKKREREKRENADCKNCELWSIFFIISHTKT